MDTFFDYSNGVIDKENKFRIEYINRIAYHMREFDSTSDEVNELINWLYYKSEGRDYQEEKVEYNRDYGLLPDKKIDNNTIVRNVWVNDMHLYSYIILLHEHNYWKNKDVLTEIIFEIYKRLDKIVHPYINPDRDLEDVKYYIELDYEPEEQ